MSTKIEGTSGVQFPDATVQGSKAITQVAADARYVARKPPVEFNVPVTPEAGAFVNAQAFVIESVVGNVVTLELGWDIIDKGTGTGAIILGYNATSRGLPVFNNRYWAVGAGRRPASGKMLQLYLQDGFIAVFSYDNTSPIEDAFGFKGSLQYVTSAG